MFIYCCVFFVGVKTSTYKYDAFLLKTLASQFIILKCIQNCKDALQETVVNCEFKKWLSCDKSWQWDCKRQLSFLFLRFYARF